MAAVELGMISLLTLFLGLQHASIDRFLDTRWLRPLVSLSDHLAVSDSRWRI